MVRVDVKGAVLTEHEVTGLRLAADAYLEITEYVLW